MGERERGREINSESTHRRQREHASGCGLCLVAGARDLRRCRRLRWSRRTAVVPDLQRRAIALVLAFALAAVAAAASWSLI